jgi:hypothetical protein
MASPSNRKIARATGELYLANGLLADKLEYLGTIVCANAWHERAKMKIRGAGTEMGFRLTSIPESD